MKKDTYIHNFTSTDGYVPSTYDKSKPLNYFK